MKEEYISIRCTKEVKDFLSETSRENDRSLSGQILSMLKKSSPQLAELMTKPQLSVEKDPEKVELHSNPS